MPLCRVIVKEDIGMGVKGHCMYWFAGLIGSEWLAQHFRLDVIEYISNEFQHKLNRDLSFIK